MLLRKGADVLSTDGPFGTLVDVVVDPIADELTHLVIAPDGELQQCRVVPLWLTNVTDQGIRVELDGRHVKELQRNLPGDFVRVPSTQRADHDVRFKTVLAQPFFVDPLHQPGEGEFEGGVPVDGFDLKCGSDVISTNDRVLGRIVGFLVHQNRIHDVVVRSGLVGFTHDVVVPIEAIAEVVADMVLLDIDRHEFRELPTTVVVPHEGTADTAIELARHKSARVWYTTRDRLRSAVFD